MHQVDNTQSFVRIWGGHQNDRGAPEVYYQECNFDMDFNYASRRNNYILFIPNKCLENEEWFLVQMRSMF